MEINETRTLENLKRLTALHFHTLKPVGNKSKAYIAQIKFVNYFELGCVITDMLKLCILALDDETHKLSEKNKNESINVSLILETILHLFPMDEFEFLSDVSEMVGEE
jgi:hypothetical protein